ncbi:MAG: DinB family protein [Ignavibacteria bacterium]|jgi:hypothetical protein
MDFNIEKAFEIFHYTPKVLNILLSNISVDWIKNNEGTDTWSPYMVVAHLLHSEKTHWISRVRTILAGDEEAVFILFDSSFQFKNCEGKSIKLLIDEFTEFRYRNIKELQEYNIDDERLLLKATHPEFGKIQLKQLLAAWVAHDLNHIKQILRIMAMQLKEEMGPWKKYIIIK